MPFIFRKHCHPCFTKDGGVIFDSQNDRYILLSQSETALLQEALLDTQFRKALPSRLNALVEPCVEGHMQPIATQTANGLHDYIWRYLPADPDSFATRRPAARFIIWVYLIQILIKWEGIAGTVDFITRHAHFFRKCFPAMTMDAAGDVIMAASRFSPFRFECLEFAIALRCYAQIHTITDARLFLGIQRFPFMAHAWVEAGEKPVGDDPSLPNRAAIIFER